MLPRIRKKLGILFTICTLLAALIPAWPAEAASSYFTFTDFSTDAASPTNLNSNIVDIKGTFSGVSSDSITYKVDTYTSASAYQSNPSHPNSSTNGNNVRPIISNGNTFQYAGVELSQGFNVITLTGTNASGNTVADSCYVYFSNVPVIYNIKLSDNRSLQLGQPLIVDDPNPTITLQAPNATNVTVQGINGFSGGNDTFIINGITLTPGLNDLTIVASNSTMTYSVTRQLVYFNGFPTAYNVSLDNSSSGTPPSLSLDNNPTVGENIASPQALNGQIHGKLIFTRDAAVPFGTLATITLDVYSGTSYVWSDTPTVTIDNANSDATHIVFDYVSTSANPLNISANGDYRLTVAGNYGTTTASYPVTFTFKNSNSPYVTAVKQIYNPTVDASNNVTYTSSGNFSGNTSVFQLPIYLEVDSNNFTYPSAGNTVDLTVMQNGTAVNASQFAVTKLQTATGQAVLRIDTLPAGDQILDITISNGTNSDTKSIPITYVPAPLIQLNNIFNGQIFKGNGNPADATQVANPELFSTISGKLINFNLATDISTIKLNINGTITPLTAHTYDATNGTFTFKLGTASTGFSLVEGPNTITISGTANGVPVTTNLTVYLFSGTAPVISSVKPVPYDSTNPMSSDPQNKFISTGANQYTTNERIVEVLFGSTGADNIQVMVDGSSYASASWTGGASGSLQSSDPSKLLIETSNNNGLTYTFRLKALNLPMSGPKSITVTASKGTATVTETLQIVRELPPYLILSPKLPNEAVINRNFLTVSIQAEGADQVLLGKTPMTKGSQDIFRQDLTNLKSGANTIKFTILRGSQKTNGQFTVNYAAQNIVGAEYKTTLSSSGKITLFNKAVTLAFPKGTLLTRAGFLNDPSAPKIDLFDQQPILFGIADPIDGRTLKRYNQVNEYDTYGNPLDGNLKDIGAVGVASNILRVPTHFGMASDLYWLDAGYFDTANPSAYQTVDGDHPYAATHPFYTRDSSKWMEPTNPGEITLAYDPNVRDNAATGLSVWRFFNNRWENLGGAVNSRQHTVTAPFHGFGFYTVLEERYGFDDIIRHPYARNYLDLMYAKGIMQAKNNNEFGVYDHMTRGEFATMLVRILDLPLNYDADPSRLTFSDVPPISVPGVLWDYRYIETAARAGIIHGTAPRVFNPNGTLTREEAAIMIASALNLKLGDPTKDLAGLNKSFTDAGLVDYYAITSVQAVVKAKLMNGLPNQLVQGQTKLTYRFDPTSDLTRADMAIISYNLLKMLKKI